MDEAYIAHLMLTMPYKNHALKQILIYVPYAALPSINLRHTAGAQPPVSRLRETY